MTVNLGAILSLQQSPPRKLVLIALCQVADKYGRASVTHEALAELTGLGKAATANAVRWLDENSLILKNPLRASGTVECYAISRRFLDVVPGPRPIVCPKAALITGCDYPRCDCADLSPT